MKAILVALLLPLLFCVPAHADGITVETLLGQCQEADMSVGKTYCYGLLDGVSMSLAMSGNLHTIGGLTVDPKVQFYPMMCVPGTYMPSPAAMAQAFVNWAKAHPDRWALQGVFGVMQALADTWPCK